MAKYFIDPFAVSGDVTAVPDDTQVNGSVSYEQGYGPDYQIADDQDPNYKDIDRGQFNQILNDVTTAIQQYQQNGVPDFITSTENGGVPFPYSKDSIVRASDGNVYYSLVDNNITTPPSSDWAQSPSIAFYYTDTSSTTNVYTLVAADGKENPISYFSGLKVAFSPHETNTGSSTIQVGSLAAVPVLNSFNSPTNILGGKIGGLIYQEFVYNGTGFVPVINPILINSEAPVNTERALPPSVFFARNASNLTNGQVNINLIQSSSTSQSGVVQLINSITSTSQILAPTANAVRLAQVANNTTKNVTDSQTMSYVDNSAVTIFQSMRVGPLSRSTGGNWTTNVTFNFPSLFTTGAKTVQLTPYAENLSQSDATIYEFNYALIDKTTSSFTITYYLTHTSNNTNVYLDVLAFGD